jgi:hypothetical protein
VGNDDAKRAAKARKARRREIQANGGRSKRLGRIRKHANGSKLGSPNDPRIP